jgi:hypothetical protein
MKMRDLKLAMVCVVSCAAVAVLPAMVLADRGGGSIRAAGRPAPPPHAEPPPRAEPPHEAPPPRAEPPHPVPEGRPEDHPEAHAPPPPPRGNAPRDWDDNDEDARHFGGYGHGVPARIIRGQHIHDLPHAHVTVLFGNQSFFYDGDGIYYQQQGDGDYLVVQPPVGAIVPYVPDGIVAIPVGPATYYYLDGVFYVAQDGSYAVVNPPPGIVVPTVPTDADQVVINGTVCYQYNGFNYTPSIQDGVTVYTVTPM